MCQFHMQIRRRAVLIYLIRPLPHVTVLWCVLCRILCGSLCLNVNEESSLFLRSLRANKLVCTMSFLRVFLWYSVQFIAWFAYQFCSLFKSVSFSEFLRKFVVEILGVQAFCFVLFSEPRLR